MLFRTKTPLGLASLALILAAIPWSCALGSSVSSNKPAAKQAQANANAASIKHGRELFDSEACGSCHTLKDAGAAGDVGPSLDGDAKLTKAFVVNQITNGGGPMPAFGEQLSEQDIADIAAYVLKASAK